MQVFEVGATRSWVALFWTAGLLAATPAAMGDLRKGQVIVGAQNSGNGLGFRVFDSNGQFVEDFSDGTTANPNAGFFDWSGQDFYATTTAGIGGSISNLYRFDGAHPHTPQLALDLDAAGLPGIRAMTRDAAGNLYLGGADSFGGLAWITKLAPDLTVTDAFSVGVAGGINALAVTRDGSLAYNASGGLRVYRHDLVNDVELPALPQPEFVTHLRLLPPYDATAELLAVMNNNSVTLARIRRLDAAGNTLQIYDFPLERYLVGVALTADETSFWALSYTGQSPSAMGSLYRVGITSGLIELGPIPLGMSGPTPMSGVSLAVIEARPKVRQAPPPPPVPVIFPLLPGWIPLVLPRR